jgi:hypothetical protein
MKVTVNPEYAQKGFDMGAFLASRPDLQAERDKILRSEGRL